MLAQRQFEELEPIANQKELLSKKLEQSASERMQLLEMAAYKDAKLALQTFLNYCSSTEANQINELNTELAEKIATCRELNSINGQVITTNLSTRQEIINILTGRENTTAINVYTANGDLKASVEPSCHQEA